MTVETMTTQNSENLECRQQDIKSFNNKKKMKRSGQSFENGAPGIPVLV